MGHVTVWIDHDHAYIFNYTAEEIKESEIKGDGGKDHEHIKKFFHKVADAVGKPNQLLVVGPGTAKNEFKHHCENHHHADLAKSIVGVETMKDHPRKSEILDVSRKFFDRHFRWHGL